MNIRTRLALAALLLSLALAPVRAQVVLGPGDLPGEGESLEITEESALAIDAGETGDLGGFLDVSAPLEIDVAGTLHVHGQTTVGGADLTIRILPGGKLTGEGTGLTLEVRSHGTVRIDNRGEVDLPAFSSASYGASTTVVNRGTLSVTNWAGKSQYDSEPNPPEDLFDNRGDAEIGTMTITANGASGTALVVNHADLAIGHFTGDVNYGARIGVGCRAGTISFGSFALDLSGTSHGSRSRAHLWTEGTFEADQFEATASGTPFDVYPLKRGIVHSLFADGTTEANGQADPPSSPEPENGARSLDPASVLLAFRSGDPEGDPVVHDVYLGPAADGDYLLDREPVATGVAATSVRVEGLDPGTEYAWKVVARENDVFPMEGPAWRFTTRPPPLEPPPGTRRSFVLPKKAVRKAASAKKAATLTVKGTLDLGPEPPDPDADLILEVGGEILALGRPQPLKGGKAWGCSAGGADLVVTPSKQGTSRAKLSLAVTGAAVEGLDPDGALDLRLAGGGLDAPASFVLARGGYRAGRVRGSLRAPDLAPLKAKAKVAGGGGDSVKVTACFATGGAVPAPLPEVFVAFGETFRETIDGAAFVRSGDRYAFRGAKGGVTSLVLDFAKEQVKLAAKGVDLGDVPEGESPVLLVLRIGEDERAVLVRMARKGKALRY